MSERVSVKIGRWRVTQLATGRWLVSDEEGGVGPATALEIEAALTIKRLRARKREREAA